MKAWKVTAAVALAMTLMACGQTPVEPPAAQTPQQDSGIRTVTLMGKGGTTVTYKVVRGTTSDGSSYEVFAPGSYTTWNETGNRRLAIYAHGYTDPIRYPIDTTGTQYVSKGLQPYPQESNGVLTKLQTALVDKGFAFAWSSYNKPGYAILSGANSTNELIGIADSALKKVYKKSATGFLSSRRYVLGHSLGGIIGLRLAETQSSSRVSGVLAMCGPVNGMSQQVKYAGDLRSLYDSYFQGNYRDYNPEWDLSDNASYYPKNTAVSYHVPTMDPLHPATSAPSDDQLAELDWGIFADSDTSFTGTNYFPYGGYKYVGLAATIAHALTQDLQAAATLARTDQLSIRFTNDFELVHSVTDALFYPVRGLRDATVTAGGSPFANEDTLYTQGGVTDPQNQSVIRYSAAPEAQQYVANNYDSTGALRTFVLTLHTDQDPQVPFSHEDNYQDKVEGQGKTRYLAQQFTRHYGHCAMTETETSNALTDLIAWAEAGPLLEWLLKPRSGDVTAP